jgi:tetratricopeptide (TPR) repeat protein
MLLALAGGGACAGAGLPDPGSTRFDALIRRGEAAEARFDPDGALRFFLQAYAQRPDDPGTMLKIAKQYSDSTLALSDPDESRRRIEKALEFSQLALRLEPRSPVALLSAAICFGKLGRYGGARERIEDARLVKEYADRALAEDPNYAYAHHVLGQWEYEVAALGRTRRLLVSLVFGGLPEASTGEGVRQLELAVELEPGAASHRLALGFAYLANGEHGKARRAFEEVIAMPLREIYDADCRAQAERAIAGLGRPASRLDRYRADDRRHDGGALLAAEGPARLRGRVPQCVDHVHPLGYGPEDNVDGRQGDAPLHDEELARVGVRPAVGHRHGPPPVAPPVEQGVGIDVVGEGAAPRADPVVVRGKAALHHETADDPVEDGAVIAAMLRKEPEILDRHGAVVG